MNKKVFRKAASLVLALALVISMAPAMGIASAVEGETTTFIFAPRIINKEFVGTDSGTLNSSISLNSLFEYLDVGDSTYIPNHYRNWKLFLTNWRSDNTTDIANAGMNNQQGLFFRYGSGSGWIALKVRGFDAGTYNVKVKAYPQKGRNIGLYVLDNATYGEADVATITNAINNYSTTEGVQKVGNADFYGKAGGVSEKLYDSIYSKTTDSGYYGIQISLSEGEFGNATFVGDSSSEYILVFKDEGEGVLDGNETSSSTEKYLSIAALCFTPTTATAKNATTFGNTAAFVERTEDNGDAILHLVSAIESVNYSKVGFNLKVNGGSVDTDTTTTVYDSITMNNNDGSTKEFTAADFGLGNGLLYVVSKKLDAGFTGQTIDFTPFAVKGEETITGSTYQATLKK